MTQTSYRGTGDLCNEFRATGTTQRLCREWCSPDGIQEQKRAIRKIRDTAEYTADTMQNGSYDVLSARVYRVPHKDLLELANLLEHAMGYLGLQSKNNDYFSELLPENISLFSPSPELVDLYLTLSLPKYTEGEEKKPLSISGIAKDELFEQAESMIASTVPAILASIAAEVADARTHQIPISENRDKFARPVATRILSHLTVDPYHAARFLNLLHRELAEAASDGVFTASWGKLCLGERGLLISTTARPQLPRARAKAMIVGNFTE